MEARAYQLKITDEVYDLRGVVIFFNNEFILENMQLHIFPKKG